MVRHHRKQRGWTQDQLAERADRSVEMINRIERGRVAPGFETLEALSLSLDVPVRDFFGIATFEAGEEREQPLFRLVQRASVLDRHDLDWLDRLVTVALSRKVRAQQD